MRAEARGGAAGKASWDGTAGQYQPTLGATRGKRTTAEVAPQHQQGRYVRMCLPPTSTNGRAPGGRVQTTGEGEEPWQDKKKKGPVEPEKEEEEDKLETFFCNLYEFHNPVPNAPVFVPAELPPRYAINFVPAHASASPAVPPVTSLPAVLLVLPVLPVAPSGSVSTEYSVISSVNFVVPPSTCIETT